MAYLRIFLWLGYTLIFYALLMVMMSIAGFSLGENSSGRLFAALALVTMSVGAILALTNINAPRREDAPEALIFLCLFWLLIPVIAALPFLSFEELPFGYAYFESVSALTTTGASRLNVDALPDTLLLWRSALQWSGGCFVATFAIIILAALNLSGTGVHRTAFFTIQRGELFTKIRSIGVFVSAIYGSLAMICAVFLIAAGTAPFEAICLALSAISTGGMVPRSGPLFEYVSGFGGIVLAITCLLGGTNIAILWNMIRKLRPAAAAQFFTNLEQRGMLAIIGALTLIGFLLLGPGHSHTMIVEAVFLVTTTGFDYHVFGMDLMPPSLIIAIALIGGSALSTAGGIKLIRFLLLIRHLQTDINRMSHPSRVIPVIFQGQKVEDRAFLSIWMYFLAYTLAFAIGSIALGAAGIEFPVAISACASALSNIGPLLQMTNPEIAYTDFSAQSVGILTAIMMIGRVEILAVLAALSQSMRRI